MVDCAVRRTKEGQDLLVERAEVEHEHLDAGWSGNRQAVEALEALEDPAHRRSRRGLVNLVGDGLAGGRQLLTQAVLGQAVDQQAEHHDATEGHDALGLLQEDGGGQEERVFEEGEAASTPPWSWV